MRGIIFGYEVIKGKTVVDEREAAVVRSCFNSYIGGDTLKSIADLLTDTGTVYDDGPARWDKAKVVRILKNRRYLGNSTYPQIISNDIFERVNQTIAEKGAPKTVLPELTATIQKLLLCTCGSSVKRIAKWKTREKWLCRKGCRCSLYLSDKEVIGGVLQVLEQVKEKPELLQTRDEDIAFSPNAEVVKKKNEIGRLAEQSGVSFHTIRNAIMEYASVRFDCCPLNAPAALTEALVEKYRNTVTIKDEDRINLIKNTVERIIINSDGSVTVCFINHAELSNVLKGEA